MSDFSIVAQHKLLEYLRKQSSSIIEVSKTAQKSTNRKRKFLTLSDRIPAKGTDLMIIHEFSDLSQTNTKKLQSIANKYQKLLVITSLPSPVAVEGESIYLTITDSPILSHLHTYSNLIATHKEFSVHTQDLEKYISEHIFELGIITQTDQSHAEMIVVCKNNEEKDSLLSFLQKSRDDAIIARFFSMALTGYAQGLDNRNARLQKNISMASTQLGKVSAGTKKIFSNTSSHIGGAITSMRENTKKSPAAQSTLQQPTRPTTIIAEKKPSYFGQKMASLQVGIYKNRNIIQNKPLSYEEFLHKQQPNSIRGLRDRRSLQSMKQQPRCSVLMIVNDIDEIWLNKSVRCMKDQTYKNWEFIIIDNASSRTYLKSYLSSLNDPRTKTFFYNSKKTYTECLAQGYKLSSGEYISILEEGDEIELDSLHRFVATVNKNQKTEFLYSDEDQINEQGKRVHPIFKSEWDSVMITSYPYCKNMFFAKRELLERIEPFKNYATRDPIWDMLLKISLATSQIVHVKRILYHKRIRPLQKTPVGVYFPDALKNYMLRETIQGSIKETKFPGAYVILKKDVINKKVAIVSSALSNENLISMIDGLHLPMQNYDFYLNSSAHTTLESSERIHLYTTGKKDFAEVTNILLAHVDADYILLMDPKLRINNPEFLTYLLSASNNEAIVGTKIVDQDDLIERSIYVKNLADSVSTLFEGEMYKGQYDISVERECSGVSAKCMLLPTHILNHIGFDETFISQLYDVDLCFQATKHDIPIIYTPIEHIQNTAPYTKEIFSTGDNATFIKKWKQSLGVDDTHIQVLPLRILKERI